jgi:hypothetical protein
MTELFHSTKEDLREQSPSLNILTKDKFGGVDTEKWSLQSNRTSKVYRVSLWLEEFILASSLFEGAIKLLGWSTVGSFISISTQLSFWGSVIMIPVVWALILMAFVCRNSPMKWPSYFIIMIVSFSFVASFA